MADKGPAASLLVTLEAIPKRLIVNAYREFEDVARGVVDESDENFSVKFE